MINDELERWKQVLTWLDECDVRLTTILESEEDERTYRALDDARLWVAGAAVRYANRIKSRETLLRQLKGSVATSKAKGGYARAEALSPERRAEIATKAANTRWHKSAAGGDTKLQDSLSQATDGGK